MNETTESEATSKDKVGFPSKTMFECPNSDHKNQGQVRGRGIPYIYRGTYKTFDEARKAMEEGEYTFHIDNYNMDRTVTIFHCKYYNRESGCSVRGKIEKVNDEYRAHLSEHSHIDHPKRKNEVIRIDPMIKEYIKNNMYQLHQYRGKELIQRLKEKGLSIKENEILKVLRIFYTEKSYYRGTIYGKIHDAIKNIIKDDVLRNQISKMLMGMKIQEIRNDEHLPGNYFRNQFDVLVKRVFDHPICNGGEISKEYEKGQTKKRKPDVPPLFSVV